MAAWRARLAERRAHAALIRAGFADQAIAAEVLRQVQVLTRTRDLARLDYSTAEAAQAAIAALITSGPPAAPPGRHAAGTSHVRRLPGPASWSPAGGINGTAARHVTRAGQPAPALPPTAAAAEPAAAGPSDTVSQPPASPRTRTGS